jgi:hypothetical protein
MSKFLACLYARFEWIILKGRENSIVTSAKK